MKVVVYSSIIGGCDSLKAAPAEGDPNVSCICYTDDIDLRRPGWSIRFVPADGTPPRKASRLLQVHSDLIFPTADVVVWVDGSCELHSLAKLLRDAGDAEFAGMEHPHRHTVWAEGEETIRLGQSPNGMVEQQLADYRADGFPSTGVTTTGLFLRRNTHRVAAFNRLWEEHLLRYGMNDQISVDYCAWKVGLPVTRLRGHYLESPYARYDRNDHHKRRKAGW